MSTSSNLRESKGSHITHSIKSSAYTILDLPPSCLEFSPGCDEHFVVGAYCLQPENDRAGIKETVQTRSGSLMLFHLEAKGIVLSLLQTITTEFAVLDLHFSTYKPNLFAVSTSIGSICLYVLETEHEESISMKRLSCFQLAEPSILILSIAWSPSKSTSTTLAYSLSNGQIGIFDYKSFEASSITAQAHSLEAWTIAWSAMKGEAASTFYSGGDDSAVCRHQMNPGQTMTETIIRDEKAHGAGVTAILPIATGVENEEVLVTGSYDEFIRVLTLGTSNRRAQVLCEKALGGGVWRLKCLKLDQPSLKGILTIEVLASCMHAGSRIIQICRSEAQHWAIKILACFEEHESMNYASDARRGVFGKNASSTTLVSTSFYDKKLCIWNLEDS